MTPREDDALHQVVAAGRTRWEFLSPFTSADLRAAVEARTLRITLDLHLAP